MGGGLVAALLPLTLLATGCIDAGLAGRSAEPAALGAVVVTEGGSIETGSGGIGSAAATPAPSRVLAAARQILADLRQGGGTPALSVGAGVDAMSRDLDRLQRHVAAAWYFDVDPAIRDSLRVRLRAAIAPDGTVRAIELIDSHGGPEDVLARFVEEAIATLDWSSPLPVERAAAPMRTLMFRFEAGPARP